MAVFILVRSMVFRFNPGRIKIQTQLPPVYVTGWNCDRYSNKILPDFDVLSSGKQNLEFRQNNIKIEFTRH